MMRDNMGHMHEVRVITVELVDHSPHSIQFGSWVTSSEHQQLAEQQDMNHSYLLASATAHHLSCR